MINYTTRLMKSILLFFIGLKIRDRPLNIYKTIIFNIHILGIKGLYCWPVYIYNNVNLYKIGKISFNCDVENGILKIGKLDYKSQGKTKFYNIGELIIEGPVIIGGASIIENFGTIIFKGFNQIGDGASLLIRTKLILGLHSRFAFHTFCMDSDDHYAINSTSKQVKRNKKPIIIGDYNWIGNRTFIKKGTITPNYLVVASSNTQLIKDYSDLPPFTVLGGSPAKIISSGIRRIYDHEIESKLNDFFQKNPDKDSFKFEINDEDLDYFCSNKTF